MLAYELAKRGVAIVSGLALGIDAIAHRGALEAGGITLAVLGNGLDTIYPASHKDLARQIVEKGGHLLASIRPRSLPGPITFLNEIVLSVVFPMPSSLLKPRPVAAP